MGMANLILPDGFAPTGLTVSARIYAGAALAATVAMAEQPAGSGRYVATWNAAAASTAYDWTAVDAGGVKYGAGPFLTDADGNEVTLARLDEPVSAPKTLTGAERTATADAARDAVEAGGGLLDQVSDAVNSVGVNVNANGTLLSNLFAGMTNLPKWLRALVRKDAPDATALSEINAGGGTYSPAADSLEAVREAVDAISVAGGAGFAGTGPHQITVTVTAVGVPVPGVAIRFDQGGITTGGTLYTNGAGVAGPFALAAGPHTLLAAKSGYAGHAEALTIAGNANLPVAIATSGVQAPPDVEHTTGVLVTRDGMGLLQPNTAVNFRLVATTVDDQQTPQAGRSFGRVFVGTSDADALLQVPLLKSARYEAWRGKGKVVAFTTGTEDSFLVPEVLAGTNDGQTV